MRLNKIQKNFRDLLLDHPRALEKPPAEFAALFAQGDIPLPERLKVYRNNVMGNLSTALVNNFPLLNTLVGEDFLRGMARAYILAQPPEQGCLNDYGADFDRFIVGFGPTQVLPYLPDVARLEIAINAAYNARDDEALTAAALASLPQDALADTRLRLRNSVRLVASEFPLDQIRAFCQRDEAGKTLNIARGGVRLMVHRPALEVLITVLTAGEFTMLGRLQAGETLGAALAFTMQAHEDFNMGAFLQRHVPAGVFSRDI